MFDDLENTLNLIIKKLETNEELLQLSISTLSTKKDVARFLDKTTKTIDNYIKNGVLIENIHYVINDNDKLEFIPLAIIDYKKFPKKKADNCLITETTALNVSSIVKGL